MSKRCVPCALAALFAAAGLTGVIALDTPRAAQAQGRLLSTSRYIVVLKDGATDPTLVAQEFMRTHGLRPELIYQAALRGFSALVPDERASILARDPRVAYVERDQEYHVVQAISLPTGINRVDADASATADIDGVNEQVDVDIAIIDTGIASHPDLNIAGGRNFATWFGSNSNFSDGNGHGTHVAGTAAARDNGPNSGGVHVVGVAPGARLWGVKVLSNSGSGFTSWIVAGIDWVTNTNLHPPIEVANMSLAGGNSQAMKDAITRSVNAGVTYVVAAGNSNVDCANTSPANHTSPGVITVSALADYNGQGGGGAPATTSYGADDTIATFSNFGTGSDGVDIAAPGVDILSTYRNGGYARLSGTSMASPHVAGTAALRIAQFGGSPAEVKTAILSAAKPASGPDGYTGGSKDSVDEPVDYAGSF